MELSYVLPAYNEASNIERAVRDALDACRRVASLFEIIVVDDGSVDATPEVLARLASEIPSLRTIRVEPNRGYTNALRTGFLAARLPWVFYTDSDNQFDPRDLDRFAAACGGADLVIGFRVGRKDDLLRRILSRGYNALQQLVLGLDVRDIDCAFKLVRREFFDLAPIESGGFLVDAEMLARARRLGLRIVELPVTHRPRVADASSIGLRHVPETLGEMVWLRIRISGWPPEGLLARRAGDREGMRGAEALSLTPALAGHHAAASRREGERSNREADGR